MNWLKKIPHIIASMTAVLLSCAVSYAELPLRNGESLTYKVSWAVLPGAGEIKITADTEAGAKPSESRFRVVTTTATRGFARVLMAFDARAESRFDPKTERLLSLHETSQQKSKRKEHALAFDYAKRVAHYTEPSAAAPRELPLPAGEPLDLITCLVQARTWNLKPGDKRDALVVFDDDFYELTIHALAIEEVKTPMGKFKALVLEPRMEKTPPKGMFKRGSTARVWISQDERRLPVRFQVEFKVGTGTANLVKHEEGSRP